MQNSSLLKILKILNPKEIKELKKFLNCSYLNKHKQCEKLFGILIQYYPEFTSPKLSSDKLYKRVFPKNSKYEGNESNFRTLVANLKKGVNQFLILEELNNNETQQQHLLLDAYINRKATDDLQAEATKKYLNQETAISSWYFYDRFKLYWKLYSQELSDVYNRKSDSFILLNKYLDHFFALTKIKLAIEQNNLKKRKVKTPPLAFIPEVQSFLTEDTKHIPEVIQLYIKLYELSSNPENGVGRFKESLLLFESIISQLSIEEITDIIAILVNFSTTKIKQETLTEIYNRLRFEVLKLGVNHQVFNPNQVMSNIQYLTITKCALLVDEFDWVFQFMEQHQQYLAPSSKELCINECKGISYYFRAKKLKNPSDYLNCINSFSSNPEKNMAYSKQKIWYTLISNYEYFLLKSNTSFFDFAQNFHTRVNRNKGFTSDQKRQLLNTMNAIKFMAKTSLNPNYDKCTVQRKIKNYRQKEYYRPSWIQGMFNVFEENLI